MNEMLFKRHEKWSLPVQGHSLKFPITELRVELCKSEFVTKGNEECILTVDTYSQNAMQSIATSAPNQMSNAVAGLGSGELCSRK